MITLTPKEQPEVPLEAENITPDAFAGKSVDEINALEIWHGNGQVPFSDFFEVEGESGATAADTKILINGDASQTKRIGQGMTAGEITVKGDVNMYVGAEMEGGVITVEGNAKGWAGQNMRGGELEILGDAGDYVGSAYRGDWRGMSGGMITVHGNAKNEIAEYMNGGKLIVKGDVAIMPGIHMNNGVLIIEGNVIARTGGEMAGGIIVVKGIIDEFLAGFEFLGVEKDIEVEGEVIPGAFYKFKGDNAIKGAKGTVYAAVAGNAHIAP
jgi:formylmethanofuran dehydrogenase subunit C